MHQIDWKRVFYIVVVPAIFYILTAVLTRAEELNPTFVLILISLSGGVCVAFVPNLIRLFTKGNPIDIEGIVCLGIMATWISNILRPSVLLLIELVPSMAWLRESDAVSFGLFVAIYGGVAHLSAPAIDAGRMPPRRWSYIGSLVAVGIFAALVAFKWPEFSALWTGHSDGLHPAGDFTSHPVVFYGELRH